MKFVEEILEMVYIRKSSQDVSTISILVDTNALTMDDLGPVWERSLETTNEVGRGY